VRFAEAVDAQMPDCDAMTQLREKIDLTTCSDRFSHGDAFIRGNVDAQMRGSAVDRTWQELSGQRKPERD